MIVVQKTGHVKHHFYIHFRTADSPAFIYLSQDSNLVLTKDCLTNQNLSFLAASSA